MKQKIKRSADGFIIKGRGGTKLGEQRFRSTFSNKLFVFFYFRDVFEGALPTSLGLVLGRDGTNTSRAWKSRRLFSLFRQSGEKEVVTGARIHDRLRLQPPLGPKAIHFGNSHANCTQTKSNFS